MVATPIATDGPGAASRSDARGVQRVLAALQRDRWPLTALLAVALATRVYFCCALPLCAEDAYITFRYALHAGQGMGLVYNPGEPSWGFTSALWTFVLSLAAALRLPLEGFARSVLVLCDLGTVWVVYRWLSQTSRVAAVACAGFFALWPRFAFLPATGLEPSLVTLLLVATVAHARGRRGGVLAGLLALSRPEGLAMSVLLLPLLRPRQRFVWLAIAAVYGVLMLHFGRLVPSSVSSKAAVYGQHWFRGGFWLEWLVPFVKKTSDDGAAMGWLSLLWCAGLVAFVLRLPRSREWPFALLLACGLGTLVGYAVLGVPAYFWYAPTPMFAVIAVACVGIGTSRVLRLGFVGLALATEIAWGFAAPWVVRVQTHDAAVYQNVGETLRADAAGRDASVLLEPIGIVGWTSGLRVLDEVGLVTPWIAAERRRGDGWYARVVRARRPDYLVVRREWFAGGVDWAGIGAPFTGAAQRDSVLADYEVVRTRVGQALPAGAGKLRVLRRRAMASMAS